VVVAVEELEVELDRLLAGEDGSDTLPVQLSALRGHIGGAGSIDDSDESGANDEEEVLGGRLGKVESDLVGGEDCLVGCNDVVGRQWSVGRREVQQRGEELGGEDGVVEVDEALGDGKVVGGRKGGEELDQEVEDLWVSRVSLQRAAGEL